MKENWCPEKPEVDKILMWNERIRQLLALLNRERVITRSISSGTQVITVPHLIEEYEVAKYAFRSPIFVDEFVDVIHEILPEFVNQYDEISDFIHELTQYYYDYPLDPVDSIQLTRLFTALEQCADFAQKRERILSKELAEEEKLRKTEFNKLLRYLSKEKSEFQTAYDYLQNTTKSYFVSDGSKTRPKHKIHALAKLLRSEYSVYISLADEPMVLLEQAMRNMLAHGEYKPEIHEEFYKHRDDIGQGIEQCIRMYTLRALKCRPEIVIGQREPLKARQFNH